MSVLDTMKVAAERNLTAQEEANKKLTEAATEAIVPCGTRVLVVREELLQKKGSLYTIQSEDSNTLPSRGTILSIGEGIRNEKIQPGVQIYFGKFAGTVVHFEGKEFSLLQENEVLAIYNPQ